MKSPKERQRAYREQRKEHKNAGLTKLKILASATTVKRLDILSEIDNIDVGNVLGQAVELIWTQRFGNAEIAPASGSGEETGETGEGESGETGESREAREAREGESDGSREAETEKPEKRRRRKRRKPEKPKTKSVKEKAVKSEKPKKSKTQGQE